jgi:hypothetical protein
MSRSPVVLLAWAALLAAIAAVEWTLFPIGGPSGWLLVALPAFAVLATVALAVGARRARPGRGRTPAPWLSPPSALLGIALATIVLGVAVGAWLWLIGLGLALLAAAGLVRERGA